MAPFYLICIELFLLMWNINKRTFQRPMKKVNRGKPLFVFNVVFYIDCGDEFCVAIRKEKVNFVVIAKDEKDARMLFDEYMKDYIMKSDGDSVITRMKIDHKIICVENVSEGIRFLKACGFVAIGA